jgi:hypothetical protein
MAKASVVANEDPGVDMFGVGVAAE